MRCCGGYSSGGSPAGYQTYQYTILEPETASWDPVLFSPNVIYGQFQDAGGNFSLSGLRWTALSSGNTDAVFWTIPLQGGYDNTRNIIIRVYWTSRSAAPISPQSFGWSTWALSDHERYSAIVWPANTVVNDVINNRWDNIVGGSASMAPGNLPISFDTLAIRLNYLGNLSPDTIFVKALVTIPITL